MSDREAMPEAAGPNKACIPVSYSRLLARELGLQMRDLPALLQGTHLNTEQFTQEATFLTAQQQIQIIHNGLILSNDDAIALRLGRQLSAPTHGAIGFLINCSPNLLMALTAYQTYLPARVNILEVTLVSGSKWLECHLNYNQSLSPEAHRFMAECGAATFFECAELIVGRSLDEVQTFFSHAEPKYGHVYSNYLAGDVTFSARQTMVRIPMYLCELPTKSSNNENYLLALQQCKNMSEQLQAPNRTLKYQIHRMMLLNSPGALTEEETAQAFFLTKRTLARRLEKENTGFREIREEILSQKSLNYLGDSRLSIDSIASLLSYHDRSNFRRAFKRWFGMTPAQYRQQFQLDNSL